MSMTTVSEKRRIVWMVLFEQLPKYCSSKTLQKLKRVSKKCFEKVVLDFDVKINVNVYNVLNVHSYIKSLSLEYRSLLVLNYKANSSNRNMTLRTSCIPDNIKGICSTENELDIDSKLKNMKVLMAMNSIKLCENLKECKNLKTLHLYNTSKDSERIASLPKLPELLENLVISETSLCEGERLKRLESLTMFSYVGNICDLSRFDNLKYITCSNKSVGGDYPILLFSKLPSSLITLSLSAIDVCIDKDLKNLRKLDIRMVSDMELDISKVSKVKLLVIHTMEHCLELTCNDMEKTINIETVFINGSYSDTMSKRNKLKKKSFKYMENLKHLELSMIRLPSSFDNIERLETLIYTGCVGQRYNILEYSGLQSAAFNNCRLSELNLDGCIELKRLMILGYGTNYVTDKTIRNIKKVQKLNVCNSMVSSLVHLKELTHINIINTNINEDGIKDLDNLYYMNTGESINDVSSLKSLRILHVFGMCYDKSVHQWLNVDESLIDEYKEGCVCNIKKTICW